MILLPITDPVRSARAARISAVEIATSQIAEHKAELQDWQKARDHALWEAQRQGVEVRVLAIIIGMSVQAVYQGIERAKAAERQLEESIL